MSDARSLRAMRRVALLSLCPSVSKATPPRRLARLPLARLFEQIDVPRFGLFGTQPGRPVDRRALRRGAAAEGETLEPRVMLAAVVESEPNGTAAEADPLAATASADVPELLWAEATGELSDTSDHDVFSIDLLAGDRVSVFVETGTDGGTQFEPYVILRDPNGGFVRSARNYNPGDTHFVGGVAEADGTYTLEIQDSFSSDSGTYRMRVDIVRGANSEGDSDGGSGNGSVDTADGLDWGVIADSVGTGGTVGDPTRVGRVGGTVNGLGQVDEDFYHLGWLNAGQEIDLLIAKPEWSPLDPSIEIVDQDGVALTGTLTDDADGRRLTATVAADGLYYARIANGRAVIDGREFRLTDESDEWQTIEDAAVLAGGHLASIETAAQNDLLYQTFGQSVWIGVNDADVEGLFGWSDGTPLGYANWRGGDPDSANNGQSNDYGILGNDGLWSVGWNFGNRRGIVETAASDPAGTVLGAGREAQYLLTATITDAVPPTVASIEGLPPENGVGDALVDQFVVRMSEPLAAASLQRPLIREYDGRSYLLVEESLTFDEADALADSLGGHLVDLNDAAEQEWVTRTFGFTGFWTGLNDRDVEGVLAWTSGEPVDAAAFGGELPLDPGTQNYSYLDAAYLNGWDHENEDHGLWRFDYDTNRYHALIELDPAGVAAVGADTDGDGLLDALDPHPDDAANGFALLGAGADDAFGTADDESYLLRVTGRTERIEPSGSYTESISDTMTLDVDVLDGPLLPGRYRFVATASLRDVPAGGALLAEQYYEYYADAPDISGGVGNGLDGNGDGIAGDDFVREFTVDAGSDPSAAEPFLFEGRGNGGFSTAAAITLVEDTAGTGLLRSERDLRGSGSAHDDADFFRFEALAGDRVSVLMEGLDTTVLQADGRNPSVPYVTLYDADGNYLSGSYEAGTDRLGLLYPVTIEADGTYFLRVETYASQQTDYRGRLDIARGDAESPLQQETARYDGTFYADQLDWEPSDAAGGGTERVARVAGTIIAADYGTPDTDHYALGRLTAGQTVDLAISLPDWSTLAPRVELVDASETVQPSSWDGQTLTATIASSGLYYARVSLDHATVDGRRIDRTEQTMTWSEAEAEAQAAGGHLVSIFDALTSHTLSDSFGGGWIGLTDEAVEGTFVWTDGSPVTYANFPYDDYLLQTNFDGYDVGYIDIYRDWQIDYPWRNRHGLIATASSEPAGTLHTAGRDARYRLDMTIGDAIAPQVAAIEGLPEDGGATEALIDSLLVSFTESVAPIVADGTAIGPEIVEYGGKLYLATEAAMNFAEAETLAASIGGRLVDITTAAEQDFIARTFGDDNYWIGLNDRDAEGVLVWSEAGPFDPSGFGGEVPFVSASSNFSAGDAVVLLGNSSYEDHADWGFTYETNSFRALIELDPAAVAAMDADGDGLIDAVDPLPDDAANGFALIGAGADGMFDTADDRSYRIAAVPQERTENGVRLRGLDWRLSILDGPLLPGQYRFVATDGLRDSAVGGFGETDANPDEGVGNRLDGDGDGSPGGDLVRTFTVDAAAEPFVYEGRGNGGFSTAAELTLQTDPDGTGLFRTAADGRGSGGRDLNTYEYDDDFFRFEARAGDSVSVRVEPVDTSLIPDAGSAIFSVQIFRADGTALAYDDRGGPDNDALISSATLDGDGTYYVRVRANTVDLHDYRVRVDLARDRAMEIDSDDRNRSANSQATDLTFETAGDVRTASVAGIAQPWYDFSTQTRFDIDHYDLGQIEAGRSLLIQLRRPQWSSVNLTAELLDAGGTVVATAADAFDGFLRYDVATAGNFYLRLTSDGDPDRDAGYVLDITDVPSGQLLFADLTVSASSISAGPYQSGQDITVDWTVTNDGDADTPVAAWTDAVILSGNAILGDADDIELARVDRAGILAVGASYDGSSTVRLPLDAAGSYTVFVVADAARQVPEFENESNNAAAEPIAVSARPHADLLAELTAFPTEAVVGDTVTVSWNVTNTGTGATGDGAGPVVDEWIDRLVLSANAILGDADDLIVHERTRAGALAAGDSYAASWTGQVPTGPDGLVYWFVHTDAADAVYERDDAASNVDRSGDPAAIAREPHSDLSPTFTDVPTVITAGNVVSVTWTVANAGPSPALGPWSDRIYLSDDEQIGNDTLLETVSVSQTLTAGESVEVTAEITLPDGASGRQYLIVLTDVFDQEYEFLAEGNNAAIASVVVADRPLADLTAVALSGPTGTVLTDTAFDVGYRIANDGDGPTQEAWRDRVWLSADATLDGSDFLLGEFDADAGSLPLAAGGSYDRTVSLALPLRTPEGSYYLLVQADGRDVELEPNEANNVAVVGQIDVETRPTPDLVLSNLTIPETASSGQPIAVSWTVTNQGAGDLAGEFYDQVWLEDAEGNRRLTESFAFTGAIAAGESVVRTQTLDLPPDFTGNWRLHVTTDAFDQVAELSGPLAELNNDAASGNVVSVGLSPFANLQVREVTRPDVSFTGRPVTIEWVVTNAGGEATTASRWSDAVYLSFDETLDGLDTYLGQVDNPAALFPGDEYRASLTATLPRDVLGNVYFLVVTDLYDEELELNAAGTAESDNLTASQSARIDLTPSADLQVTDAVGPLAAFSGTQVDVLWTVTNEGNGPTEEDRWTDRVWLSDDATLDAGDIQLGTARRLGGLAAGESYDASLAVTLPVGVTGDYFLLVQTDAFGEAFEYAADDNNVSATDVFTIRLTPPPDLETVSVSAPAMAVGGERIEIAYRIENNGATATPEGSWNDAVYLSTDDVFDSGDILVAQVGYSGGSLAAGDGYDGLASITLADDLLGGFHVFVVADLYGRVFEVDRDNNVGRTAAPIDVVVEAPDLAVASLTLNNGVSAPVEAGRLIRLDWTVENRGIGAADGLWRDTVYLSDDDTLDSADRRIGTIVRNEPVAAGGSYSVAGELMALPFDLAPGDYFVFLSTDDGGRVFEDGREGNNAAAVPITITRTASDLVVQSIAVELTAESGQIDVEWIVRNDSPVDTNARSWIDQVWLSPDGQIDGDAVLLGEAQRNAALVAGGIYTQRRTFALPDDLAGSFRIVVRTDAHDDVEEGADESNNDASVQDTIGGDPIVVVPPRPSDLAVSDVTLLAAPAYGGQDAMLRWTVANIGEGATRGLWYDTVFLSTDQVLDRRTDRAVGSFLSPQALDPGDGYTREVTVRLPTGFVGPYYLIVGSNLGEGVDEDGRLFDNAGATARFDLDPLPPVDFAVGEIVVPVGGLAGQPATIGYTVTNTGVGSFAGRWTDSVYLSADGQWDIDDAFLGFVERDGTLAAGGSYTASLTAPLPSVVPGDYQVIVRSDIFNVVAEPDETNNIGISLDAAAIDLPSLTLNAAEAVSLPRGSSVVYRVDAPAGESLSLSVAGTDAVELFVAYDRVPTASRFDLRSAEPFTTEPRVTVPRTQGGTYYVLVRSVEFGDGAVDFDLLAEIAEFDVFEIDRTRGGNVGDLTVAAVGAQLDRTLTARLENADGETVGEATRIELDGSTRAYVTFDLRGLETGLYDVVFANGDGETVRLDDGMHVLTGGGGVIGSSLVAPAAVRGAEPYHVTVRWTNTGLNDAAAPLLHVARTGSFTDVETGIEYPGDTLFLAVAEDGPEGIMRAGRSYDRRFRAVGPGTMQVTRRGTDPAQAFNWDWARGRLSPPGDGADVVAFDALFDAFVAQVGGTWGDYHRVLVDAASKLSDRFGPRVAPDPDIPPVARLESGDRLLQLALDDFAAAQGRSIIGTLAAVDPRVDFGEVTVTATHQTTGRTHTALAREDGRVVLPSLPIGTYRLRIGGAVVDGPIGDAPILVEVTDETPTAIALDLVAGGEALGRVVDAEGFAVAGAEVSIVRYAGDDDPTDWVVLAQAATDQEGRFGTTGLRGGTYRMTVSADGYADSVTEFAIAAGELLTLPTLTLGIGGIVSGSVVVDGGGDLDQTLTVAIRPEGEPDAVPVVGAVGEDGRFAVVGAPLGRVVVTVDQAGYVPAVRTVELTGETPTADLGVVTLVLGGVATGTVTNATSQPIETLEVQAVLDGVAVATATVEADGTFAFDGLADGDYEFSVAGAGLFSTTVTANVGPGSDVSGLALAVQAGATISGTITAGGSPAAGLIVSIAELGTADEIVDSAVTDAAGTYSLAGLAAGTYRVSVPGSSESVDVTIADPSAASDQTADFTLDAAASLGGTVRTASGSAIDEALVQLLLGDRVVASSVTAVDGRYSFFVSQAGDYVVRVAGGATSAETAVMLPAAGSVTADLSTGSGSIAIGLGGTLGDGELLVGLARIDTAVQFAVGELMVAPGETPTFTDLAAGTYRLTVAGDDGSAFRTVVIADGETATVSVDTLTQTSVSGRVTDEAGEAVSGALVVLESAEATLTTITLADGAYSLASVPTGDYTLTIYHDGFAPIVGDLTVDGIETANATLVASNTRLAGTIVDADGQPTAGTVEVRDAAGRLVAVGFAEADGAYSLTVPAGTLEVTVAAAGFTQATFTTTATASQTTAAGASTIATIAVGTDATAAATGDEFAAAEAALEQALTSILEASVAPFTDSLGEVDDRGFSVNGVLDWVRRRVADFRVDEVSLSELPPLPDCPGCESAYEAAGYAVRAQAQFYDMADRAQKEAWESRKDFLFTLGKDIGELAAMVISVLKVFKIAKGIQTAAKVGKLSCAKDVLLFANEARGFATTAENAAKGSKTEGSSKGAGQALNEASRATAKLKATSTRLFSALTSCLAKKGDGKFVDEGIGETYAVFSKMTDMAKIVDNFLGITDSFDLSPSVFAYQRMDAAVNAFESIRDNYLEIVELAGQGRDRYLECVRRAEEQCDPDNPPEPGQPLPPLDPVNDPTPDDETVPLDDRDPDDAPQGPDDEAVTEQVAAYDPNDILGPDGYGPDNWVSAAQPLDFTIRFENDPDLATAPAQTVRITQQLDADLDFRTFRLGDFGIGELTFEVPDGRAFYSDRLDLTATHGVLLDVFAGVDVLTGEAFWEFRAVDPATGRQPSDPLVGLLPINTNAPEGEGFASYSIRAKDGLDSGTRVDSLASIVFDQNEPIETPAIFHTLDPIRPTSEVTAIAAPDGTSFALSWTGEDDIDGSGLARFDVYVSVDGGPARLLIGGTTETTLPFVGEEGRDYAFYSVAYDNAGNAEYLPVALDATVTIGAFDPAPVVDRTNAGVRFVENRQPIFFARSARVLDVDIDGRPIAAADGYTLRIAMDPAAGGSDPADLIGLLDGAGIITGAESFGLAGSAAAPDGSVAVSVARAAVGFVEIGRVFYEGHRLTVVFNAEASMTDVTRVLRRAAYQNTSERPARSEGTLVVTVEQPDGRVSDAATTVLTLVAQPDPPQIALPGSGQVWTEDGDAVALFGLGTLADLDSDDFGGTFIEIVTLTPRETEDRLILATDLVGIDAAVAAAVSLDGTAAGATVRIDGRAVATLRTASSSRRLAMDLVAGATAADVMMLLAAIGFDSESQSPPDAKTLRITVIDPDGGRTVLKPVMDIAAINDPPAITRLPDAPVAVVAGDAALPFARTFTVVDPDFTREAAVLAATIEPAGGGFLGPDGLTLTIAEGGNVSLAIDGGDPTQATVSYRGAVVGTATGLGTDTLVVSFDPTARIDAVRSVGRRLAAVAAAGATPGQRSVRLDLTDGFGDAAVPGFVVLDVTAASFTADAAMPMAFGIEAVDRTVTARPLVLRSISHPSDSAEEASVATLDDLIARLDEWVDRAD